MSLGEARVEILPDFSGFDSSLKRSLADGLGKAQAQTDRATKDISAMFTRLSDAARRAFDLIDKDSSNALAEVRADFDKASAEAQEALQRIARDDAFGDIERRAERTGESIEGSFREAARQSESALNGISSGLGRIGVGLGAALAGLGLGSFLKTATLDAQAANSALANTVQLIESTGGVAGVTAEQITNLADSLRFQIGIDDTAVIEASNVLLTFKAVSAPIFDETIMRAADLSAVFGTDLQGATMQLGKALNDPIKGLTALSRSGVSFTQEQKDTIAAMVEVGDVAGAQRLILDELAVQFGGTAAASADSTARLAANFGELREAIGSGLIGALDQVTPGLLALADQLVGPMEIIGQALGEFAAPLLEAFGPAVQVLVTQFATVLTDIGSIFANLAPLVEPIVQIVGVLATYLSGVLAAAFQALAPAIQIVGEFLGVMADRVGEQLFSALESVTPVLIALGRTLGTVLVAVLPIVMDLFDALVAPMAIFADLAVELAPVISNVARILAGVFASVLRTVVGIIETLLPPLAQLIADLVAGLAPILPSIALLFKQLVDALLPLVPPLLEIVMTLLPPLSELLLALVPIILELAQGPLQLFVLTMEQLQPLLLLVAEGIQVVADYLVEVIDWLTEGAEKTTELGGVWQVIWDGMKAAFEAVRDAVLAGWDMIDDYAIPVITGVRIAFGTAMSIMGTVFSTFRTAVEIGFGIIKTVAETVGSAISTAFSVMSALVLPIFDTLQTVGSGIFNAIGTTVTTVTEGIKTAFNGVKTAVTGVASAIESAFKGAWNGIARAWNNSVGSLSFSIPSWVPGLGGSGFDVPNIPTFADGTIANRPTYGIFGEAGPEAVIPISRPARAIELMEMSGLADLVRSQGGGPAVMIQSATFADATDADLVAQRVNTALRVRAFA